MMLSTGMDFDFGSYTNQGKEGKRVKARDIGCWRTSGEELDGEFSLPTIGIYLAKK